MLGLLGLSSAGLLQHIARPIMPKKTHTRFDGDPQHIRMTLNKFIKAKKLEIEKLQKQIETLTSALEKASSTSTTPRIVRPLDKKIK